MNMRKNILSTSLASAVLAMTLGGGSVAFADDDPKDDPRYTEAGEPEYSGELRDAWLDGKIETAFALNSHLNPFRIDTDEAEMPRTVRLSNVRIAADARPRSLLAAGAGPARRSKASDSMRSS